MPPPLDIFNWIHSGYRLEAKLEEALQGFGLSLAKLNVLTHMAEAQRSLALSEIAAKLNCVRSNVTQLVDRLEADGFMRRLYDPNDRRSVRAELTDLGRESQQRGAEAVAKVAAELAQAINASDLQALQRLAAAIE